MAPKWLGKVASALGKGAEIATGIGIFYNWASSKLSGMMVDRFGLADPAEQQQLSEFAQSGVDSGSLLSSLSLTDKIDPLDIPVNPYLFGDSAAGRRGKYVGEFQIFPGERWYRMDIDVSDFDTLEALLEDMYDRAAEWISASPTAFGLAPTAEFEPNQVRVIFVERKW